MLFTVLGTVTDIRLEQPSKKLFPIAVIWFGNSIDFKLEQP